MSQSLRSNELTFIYNGSYRNTNDYNTNAVMFDHNWALTLSNGSGSGNANFAWQDQLTISASSSSTIDLNALTDEYGNSIAPTIVKMLAVRLYSSSDTAATLNVGAAASNIFSSIFANSSDIAIVRYGGWVVWAATDATGYAVSGSIKNLKIANNSSTQSVTVDVVVVGVK